MMALKNVKPGWHHYHAIGISKPLYQVFKRAYLNHESEMSGREGRQYNRNIYQNESLFYLTKYEMYKKCKKVPRLKKLMRITVSRAAKVNRKGNCY